MSGGRLPVTFHPGRLAPYPEETHPRVKLAPAFNKAVLPPPPVSVNWYGAVTSWPMLYNDQAGDCVEAEQGHHEQVFTTYGLGKPVTFTDADAIAAYSAITGYDPSQDGPNGNPTDQGTVIQSAMDYWRKVGFAGRKIAAFAEVNVKDEVELKTALALLGPLSGGMNFPAVAMQQFNDGKPWDVVKHDGGIEGGHCVCIVGYDDTFVYCITWGAVQKMTWAFFRKYFEELWAPISTEWVNEQTGLDPEGVDLSVVGDQFASLTGQANPFPGPTPQPEPSPTPEPPGPSPTPVGPADQSLAVTAHEWLQHRHSGANAVMAKELRAWLAAKSL
jgi:hypothetical protein